VPDRRKPLPKAPALVLVVTWIQLSFVAAVCLITATGVMYWMTTMAANQSLSVEKLDSIRLQGAGLRETIEAHVSVMQQDNRDFLFYARAVCEQLAGLGKRDGAICAPTQLPLQTQPRTVPVPTEPPRPGRK